ncbi:hypothetical protein ABPG72_009347 [Tetrahymena utriculariae]
MATMEKIKRQSINNDFSSNIDQNSLSQINDGKRLIHNNDNQKIDTTSTTLENFVRPQRGRSQIIQLDNYLNLVQNNMYTAQQNLSKITCFQTKNDPLRLFQQFQPKKIFLLKNYNFQNGSFDNFNCDSQNKTNDEMYEFAWQASYSMLQIVDKSKIFKYY